jgi:hypothetical protein
MHFTVFAHHSLYSLYSLCALYSLYAHRTLTILSLHSHCTLTVLACTLTVRTCTHWTPTVLSLYFLYSLTVFAHHRHTLSYSGIHHVIAVLTVLAILTVLSLYSSLYSHRWLCCHCTATVLSLYSLTELTHHRSHDLSYSGIHHAIASGKNVNLLVFYPASASLLPLSIASICLSIAFLYCLLSISSSLLPPLYCLSLLPLSIASLYGRFLLPLSIAALYCLYLSLYCLLSIASLDWTPVLLLSIASLYWLFLLPLSLASLYRFLSPLSLYCLSVLPLSIASLYCVSLCLYLSLYCSLLPFSIAFLYCLSLLPLSLVHTFITSASSINHVSITSIIHQLSINHPSIASTMHQSSFNRPWTKHPINHSIHHALFIHEFHQPSINHPSIISSLIRSIILNHHQWLIHQSSILLPSDLGDGTVLWRQWFRRAISSIQKELDEGCGESHSDD